MSSQCIIWATKAWGADGSGGGLRVSPRVGCRYIFNVNSLDELYKKIADPIRELDDKAKARLTTMILNDFRGGIRPAVLTPEMIKKAQNTRSLSMMERINRLLQFFEFITPAMGQPFNSESSFMHERYRFGETSKQKTLMAEACAWSESIELSEVVALCKFCKEEGWIETTHFSTMDIPKPVSESLLLFSIPPEKRDSIIPMLLESYPEKLTPKGYMHLEELRTGASDPFVEQNQDIEFHVGETEDDWEPLPIEQGSEKLVEAINTLTAAIEAIREDNGYAANKPDERKAVLSEAEAGKKALEEQEQVFKFQIRNLVRALKKAAKTFISTTILGGKIALAINAIFDFTKDWLDW